MMSLNAPARLVIELGLQRSDRAPELLLDKGEHPA